MPCMGRRHPIRTGRYFLVHSLYENATSALRIVGGVLHAEWRGILKVRLHYDGAFAVESGTFKSRKR